MLFGPIPKTRIFVAIDLIRLKITRSLTRLLISDSRSFVTFIGTKLIRR
jgi:hypothetical protein